MGKRSSMRVPIPGSLAMTSSPPTMPMKSRTVANPTPVPLAFVVALVLFKRRHRTRLLRSLVLFPQVLSIGAASLLSEVALVGIQGALAQESFRRPPARRLLKRRY